MTVAKKSQGVVIRIGTKAVDPSGDTFTQIKGIDTFGAFGSEAAVIDATELDSTFKEKIKGIPDVGDLEISGNRSFQDPGQQALKAAGDATSDAPYNFEIEFADKKTPKTGTNTKISFKALVTSFKTTPGEVEGKVGLSATLAITGATTEVVAT